MLASLGLLGVLLHNLVKLNDLNKECQGHLDFGQYFRLEWISILISVIVVIGATEVSQEIVQLEQAGKWLGFGFIAVGYLAQSLLVKVMGKAQAFMDDSTK